MALLTGIQSALHTLSGKLLLRLKVFHQLVSKLLFTPRPLLAQQLPCSDTSSGSSLPAVLFHGSLSFSSQTPRLSSPGGPDLLLLGLEHLLEFGGRTQGALESCSAQALHFLAAVLHIQGTATNGKQKLHLVISWQVPPPPCRFFRPVT